MLLNSLRVTANEGQLVVLDSGQRALLEGHAEVVDVPTEEDPGHAGLDEAVPLPLAQALLTVWD